MSITTLYNLDSDILFELLALSPNLSTLRCLIEVHRSVYDAYTSRRRLILRRVFKAQILADGALRSSFRTIFDANALILKIKASNPIDIVAFRESIWPDMEPLLKGQHVTNWATALLTAYHTAGLDGDALRFAKRISGLFLNKHKAFVLGISARRFLKAAVRTHFLAGLDEEATRLQERVLERLTPNPRSMEHNSWAKELAATYKKADRIDLLMEIQLKNWERYRELVGANNDTTLDWARALVCTYQTLGRVQDALEFHARVRKTLDPTKPQYFAWSRQLIRMYQRQHHNAEALLVTRDVCNQLGPESKGYRAWIAQLSDAYEADSRPEDAVRVREEAWKAIYRRYSMNVKDSTWRYQTTGAGLGLVAAYKKHGRSQDAASIEAICASLRPAENEVANMELRDTFRAHRESEGDEYE